MNKTKIVLTSLVGVVVVILGAIFITLGLSNSGKPATREVNKETLAKDFSKMESMSSYGKIDDTVKKNITSAILTSPDLTQRTAFYAWYIGAALTKEAIQENKDMKAISISKLKEKIKNKENFVVMFSQPQCPHCLKLKKDGFKDWVKTKGAKYNFAMVNFQIASDSDWKNSSFGKDYKDQNGVTRKGIYGTPTVSIFKNGVVQKSIVSEKAKEVIEEIEKTY